MTDSDHDHIDEIPPAPSDPFAGAPFAFLGHDAGIHHFLSHGTQQIASFPGIGLSKAALLTLAPLVWWRSQPEWNDDEDGTDWTLAVDYVLRRSESSGIYRQSRVRGRGAWVDTHPETGEEVIILHAGDTLTAGGHTYSPAEYKSKYHYVAGAPIDLVPTADPLHAEASVRFLELCRSLQWRDSLSGYLLAGWCVVAPIGGALRWRPHIWLNGPSGSGKSWVLDNIVSRALGNCAVSVQSATTEAGIRQTLKNDSLPIIVDEAESENRNDQERMQRLLILARASSSESGSIVKGSASGTAQEFTTRSCFCFASIGVAATQKADRSRITSLELRRGTGAEAAQKFEIIRQILRETCSNSGYTESLRARSFFLAGSIRQNAALFSDAITDHLGERRIGDQIGALLAGAWSLTSAAVLTMERAREWIQAQDWSTFRQTDADTDEVQALAKLCDAHIRFECAGETKTLTVSELVSLARDTEFQDAGEAKKTLRRNGVALSQCREFVFVAASHDSLRRVFLDTPWAGKWRDQLARCAGAVQVSAARFGASTHRAVRLPVELFLGAGD